jgi:NarL family two-component system response regulator LiaR
VRRGIASSLQPYEDLEVVAEVDTGERAVQAAQDVQPDVVLMDLLMPGMGGIAAIRSLREMLPETQIIALTSFREGNLVEEALLAGAIGYLLKDVDVDDLVKAVRLAHQGVPTLAPAAGQALVKMVASGPPALGHDLTEREQQVLGLMAKGLSNQQIADQLVITPATVKFHTRSIRSKLGTASRTETVVLALQHHLVAGKP